MAKGKPMAALLPICFLFLLALASAAEIIDNNGVVGEDLNNGADMDNHHHKSAAGSAGGDAPRRTTRSRASSSATSAAPSASPGTYGNKETCPCYNNWKTKEGGPKCP
ncbi:gibberellin-regulated protein 5-like [Panicum miliaceum]|uniref:Gibberellin-regulated protein 5-like n=1 Tax=Panicum miliaceum TaxID=4540 RepID=A0A3L6RFU7_PANMI|nr:gibberellin-regulated protein 5-like [Panicum miliaceum]